MSDNDTASLNQASREAWEQIAPWWDDHIGAEGNAAHRLMIAPAVERLLNLQSGEYVLDCACGNGQFSRRLAQLGARVTAFDFSAAFLERARAHTADPGPSNRINYHHCDATDEAQLLAFGVGRFSAVVCLSALMDMPAIEPLFRALRQLLQPGGRFVFSITHPCFNSADGLLRVLTEEDRDGKMVETHAVQISRYLTPSTHQGIGIVGQPAPHYYFHRPLHVLFKAAFDAGFVMDGLEEPETFQREGRGTFSWTNFPEIPPFLVVRLR